MSALLLAAVKVSVVLAAALAAAALLRRRSAALRHWVLAMGFTLAALTPPASLLLPSWPLPAWTAASRDASTAMSSGLRFSADAVDIVPDSEAAAPPAPRAWSLDRFLLIVWLAGATLVCASLGIGTLRLAVLARRAIPVRRQAWLEICARIAASHGVRRRVTLLQSAHPALLVTWGLWRPKVLLPAAARFWSDERIAVVLHHELAHIRRADWAIQLAAALMRGLCWFNPLAWLAYRKLRQASEHACDDLVLRHGIDGATYATHLVEIARTVCQPRQPFVPAPAVAHPSTLEQRVRAMLNPDCDRRPPNRLTRIGTALTLSAAALTVAAAAMSAETAASAVAQGSDRVLVDPTPIAATVDTMAPGPLRGPGLRAVTEAGRDRDLSAEASAKAAAAPPAQAGIGTFSGRVFDPSGAVLPGVTMTLTSTADRSERRAVSDSAGSFTFAGVSAGDHRLTAVLPGFRTAVLEVSIAPDAVLERSVMLQIGSLQETITVVGTRGSSVSATVPQPPWFIPPAPTPRPAVPTNLAVAVDLPVRVGGVIRAPTKIRHVNPIYPASMQVSETEGVVILQATIDIDGYVREVTSLRVPHADLAAAAIEAVKGWQFTPTRLNNQPVDVSMTVTVQFSLR
jgi:TonB family protein